MHDRSGVDRLIADLTRPEAFPSPPERVETLQTHASVIFFAGERVYKVKKPVDFGFLNFSTLQRRRFFCEEEIRLNRRLAPDAYLGVRTIVEDDEGRLRIANEDDRGPVVDYAVEMRRLPADQMLAKLLERADVADNDIARLVDVLVEFHDRAEAGGDVPEFGRPGAVRRRVGVNLSETEKFAGELPDDAQPGAPAISRRLLLALQAWTSAWIDRNEGLIAARAEQGRIREGHGDLHAGNICVLPDRIVIYDCIEFERSFRCADVASDLAFLGMDLDRRGHPRLARDVIDRYARQSGDPDVPALQPLYRVHYACVRGKVDALRSREQEVDPDERIDAWRSAAAYFALAAGYIAPPALVLMCGAPGSGKSWLAEPLAAALRADWLRSDVKRKELLGLGPTERAGEDAYTADSAV